MSIEFKGFPAFFHIESGWSVQVAGLPSHVFHFVLDGAFDAVVGERRETITGPGFSFVSPGVAFDFRSIEGRPIALYRCRVAIVRRGVVLRGPLDFFHASQANRFHSLMERIIHEAEHPSTLGEWKLRGLLMTLFAKAFADAAGEPEAGGKGLDAKRLRRVTAYFHQHHREWPESADLAREVGMSHDYFSRQFRRATGLAPRRWMTRERIRLAALQLAESNLNISEVAETFGYANVFFFSQQFKDVMKQSPSAYRRERRTL